MLKYLASEGSGPTTPSMCRRSRSKYDRYGTPAKRMDVAQLCAELEADPIGNANNVGLLLSGMDEMREKELRNAVVHLEKFFASECADPHALSVDGTGPEALYARWLRDNRKIFRQKLEDGLNIAAETATQVMIGMGCRGRRAGWISR